MSGAVPKNWDVECEVLVVGGGTAGSVAAITAHDEGADVLIVEKLGELGGNCNRCGGNLMTPTNGEFVEYLDALSHGTTEREILETFVRGGMKNEEWIKKMGGQAIIFAPLQVVYPGTGGGAGYPQAPKSEYMIKLNVKATGSEVDPPGVRLWRLIKKNIESRKIRIMTGAPVKEIIKTPEGTVVGAMAEKGDKKVYIKAKKAVILTNGGYENDSGLKWEYYSCKPVAFLGSPGNSGDGIRLAQKVGADLWHMTNMVCVIGFQAPGYEAAFSVSFYSPEFIFVSKYGKRFFCETGIDVHGYGKAFAYFDPERLEFPNLPAWSIFTERNRRMAPLNSGNSGMNRERYKWSTDNSAEIAKGWIIKGDSLAELAKKISVDASVLENTIKAYNQHCKAGKDLDFGRPKEDLVPIQGPPYYAVQIWPSLFCTQGGPRRDKESRVLDPDRRPIPRLYAAGELGSVIGFLYQGGANLTDCIVFGQIAGRNAAAEKNID